MKQKTLILLFGPFMLWACKDEECPCNEYVEVTFQLNGEWTEDNREPIPYGLNDLFGIDVRLADGTPYAYGLFDHMDKAILKIKKNEKYTIRVIAAPESKEECAYMHVSTDRFEEVFLTDKEPSYLGNTFLYETGNYFIRFNSNYHYALQLYKGYLPVYQTEQDNIISLDMKRCFGFVQFSINNFIVSDLRFCFFPKNEENPQQVNYRLTSEQTNVKLPYSFISETEDKEIPNDISFANNYKVYSKYYNPETGYGEKELGSFPTSIYKGQTTTIEFDLEDYLPLPQ